MQFTRLSTVINGLRSSLWERRKRQHIDAADALRDRAEWDLHKARQCEQEAIRAGVRAEQYRRAGGLPD